MKNNQIPCIGAILITLVFSFNTGIVHAQESDLSTKDTKCVEEMKPFMEEKTTEFREYLTQHFQSKKTNTSLLDLALKRFELYKKELRDKYKTYFAQTGKAIFSETHDNLSCKKKMDEEIKTMEMLLKSYYKQTSNIKTSTAYMTKLQQINKKLDTLVFNITQMLGKWNSLENRIPCFVKQCL